MVLMALLALMALFSVACAATVNGATYDEVPFSNENFLQKLKIVDETFITPRTHPYLFAFSGRWNRRRNVYKASSWPGTSVKILLYGDKLKVKLRCPQRDGIVKGHYFIASISNGPQLVLKLPPYNATENQEFDLNVALPELEVEKAVHVASLPREVELISEPRYPISLVGITIQNLQIQQGRAWMQKQNLIPHVEYISDKLAESPVLNQTAVYKAARQLELRQSYIFDYNICFSNCVPRHSGLADEYAYFEPFHYKHRPLDARLPTPINYVFHRDEPLLQTTEPQFLMVDVGDNDLHNAVPGETFLWTLQKFLANIIVNAHPNARIFVFVRNGRYELETETAILSLQRDATVKLHAVKFGKDNIENYKQFFCSHVLPFSDERYPYNEQCRKNQQPGLRMRAFTAIQMWQVASAASMSTIIAMILFIRRKGIWLKLRPRPSYQKVCSF